MRAVVFSHTGGPEVLRLVERPVREPGPGEVLVEDAGLGRESHRLEGAARESCRCRASVSRVRPQPGRRRDDRRHRRWRPGGPSRGARVALGGGLATRRRHGAGTRRYPEPPSGTTAGCRLDGGWSEPRIPALTAHRCLTVSGLGPRKLASGALNGQTVLVAGGAGAVGHAAIQLARWAPPRGHHRQQRRQGEARPSRWSRAGRQLSDRPGRGRDPRARAEGIDAIVEVAPTGNAVLDAAVLAPNGTVAAYATDGGASSR